MATNNTNQQLGIVNEKDAVYFESMSGANTTILFEIPNARGDKTIFVLLRSAVTVSVNTSRAKMPITTLGQNSISGFALGNKTVAGSIIKALVYEDEFDKQVQIYTEESLKMNKSQFFNSLGTKTFYDAGNKFAVSHKHFDSVMKDDLLPFNIHIFSYNEYTGFGSKFLLSSIFGCTIINEGLVHSIENLITESTFTYVAKYAQLGHDARQNYQSYETKETTLTGSQLLARNKT